MTASSPNVDNESIIEIHKTSDMHLVVHVSVDSHDVDATSSLSVFLACDWW